MVIKDKYGLVKKEKLKIGYITVKQIAESLHECIPVYDDDVQLNKLNTHKYT